MIARACKHRLFDKSGKPEPAAGRNFLSLRSAIKSIIAEKESGFFMKQQPYLAEIANLLEAILEETETISQHRGRIPQIELDIVMENIRKLYEAYHGLNKHNADIGPVQKEKPVSADIIPEAPPAPAAAAKAAQEESPPPVVPEVKESPAAVSEPLPQASPPPPPPATEVPPAPKPEPPVAPAPPIKEAAAHTPRYTIPKRPSDIPSSRNAQKSGAKDAAAQSIAEKYKSEEKTLNDQVEGNGLSVADRLQQNKISDLKTALGINDKFLLISELFEGDSGKYNEAIDKLNAFEGFAEASVHLQHLQQRFTWKEDSPAFQKFRSFIRRRYL